MRLIGLNNKNIELSKGKVSILNGRKTTYGQQERRAHLFQFGLHCVDLWDRKQDDLLGQTESTGQYPGGLLGDLGGHRDVLRFRVVRRELVQFRRYEVAQFCFGVRDRLVDLRVAYADLFFRIVE